MARNPILKGDVQPSIENWDMDYVSCFLPRKAPILAVMIEGTERILKTIIPSGNKLPGPCVNSIHENWPSRGRIPHRHDLFGSRKPNMADARCQSTPRFQSLPPFHIANTCFYVELLFELILESRPVISLSLVERAENSFETFRSVRE
jgi:hypothetical protein